MSKMRKFWRQNQVAVVTGVLVLLVVVFPVGSFLKAQMPIGDMRQPTGTSMPSGGMTQPSMTQPSMTQPSMTQPSMTQPSMGGSYGTPSGTMDRSGGMMQPSSGSYGTPSGTMDRSGGMTQPSSGSYGTPSGTMDRSGGMMQPSSGSYGTPSGTMDRSGGMMQPRTGTDMKSYTDTGKTGVGNPPTFMPNQGEKSIGTPPTWGQNGQYGEFEDYGEGEFGNYEEGEFNDYGMKPMQGKQYGFEEFNFDQFEEGEFECNAWDPSCRNGQGVEKFESNMDMYMQDYSEFDSEEMDSKQAQRELKDISRQTKDIANMVKQARRQFKKIDLTIQSPVITNINSILTEMETIQAAGEALSTASTATSAQIEEMRDKFDYLRQDLEPQLRDLEPQLRVFEELKNFNKELERLSKETDNELAKFEKRGVSEECLTPLTGAQAKIAELQANPMANLDTEFMDPRDMYEQLDTVRFEYLDPARECAGNTMREQFKGKKVGMEDALGTFDEDIASQIEEKLFSKMSNIDDLVSSIMEQVMSRVMEQMATVIERVSADVANKMAKMTENIASAPKEIQEKASATQEEVYAVVEEVSEAAESLDASTQKEVEKVVDAFAGELWTADTASELAPKVAALETLIENGAEKSEIVEEAREVKQAIDDAKKGEANKQFAEGLRPWKDVDPTSDWHAGYDFKIKDLGIMKGDGASGYTELKPANETNRAEAVVMAARAAGIEDLGTGKTPTSRAGQGMPDWAKPAAAALEAQGVNLDSVLKGSADGSITRGEASVLVAESLNLEATSDSVANNFKDSNKFDPSLTKAAAALYENGIMTGYGKGSALEGQLGVDQPFLRAELAKVIVEAQEVVNEK